MSLFYGPCLMLYWNDLLQAPVKAFFCPIPSLDWDIYACILPIISDNCIQASNSWYWRLYLETWYSERDTVIDATFGNCYDTLAMVNVLDNELARAVFMQWIFKMMFREYFFFARRVAQTKRGALFSQFHLFV